MPTNTSGLFYCGPAPRCQYRQRRRDQQPTTDGQSKGRGGEEGDEKRERDREKCMERKREKVMGAGERVR